MSKDKIEKAANIENKDLPEKSIKSSKKSSYSKKKKN